MWRRVLRVPRRGRTWLLRRHRRARGSGLHPGIHRRPSGSELGRRLRSRRLRSPWHGGPRGGRQGGSPRPGGSRLRSPLRSPRRRTGRPARNWSLSLWMRRRCGRAGGPRRRRSRGRWRLRLVIVIPTQELPKRPGVRLHGRTGRPRRSRLGLRLILVIPAQELSKRDVPERRPRALLFLLHRSRPRLSLGLGRPVPRVIAQELPRIQPSEHALLLGRGGRRGPGRRGPSPGPRGRGDRRATWRPRPRPRARGLGIQLDVALRAGDAVALLQVKVEPQLWNDARDDAQPGDERQLVHRREVEGARHRHLQALALVRQREHEVLLRQRRRNQRQRRRRDVLELRIRGQGVARLLREHLAQLLDGEVLQLDQVGTQPAAIDHLGLEGLVELSLVDEALADQDRTELFRHEALDSRRLQ
jgi:hypothetical protein